MFLTPLKKFATRVLNGKAILALFYLAGLVAFLYIIQNILNEYRYRDIEIGLKRIKRDHLAYASILAVINYFILTFYDAFSIQYIKKTLQYSKIAFASFISYTFSHNIGFGPVSGGAMRLRFYTKWGFTPFDVAKMVFFSGVNFWLGLLFLGSCAAIISPASFAKAVHIPKYYSYVYGILLFVPVAAYLLLVTRRQGNIKIFSKEFEIPSSKLVSKAFSLAVIDWIISAAVFFALLPNYESVSYFTVLTAFIIAQIVGVISHVPGGLGVFETVILLSLGRAVSKPDLVAALLLFRCIYYLLPFCFGIAFFSFYEIRTHFYIFRSFKDRLKAFEPILSSIVPQVLSVATFIAGLILLFSSTTPAIDVRMDYISNLVPLKFIETSHFINSITGILLIFVSWSIKKRLIAGRILAMLLSLVGAAVSILKGLDFEEAVYCAILFTGLLFSGRFFYRNSKIFSTLNFQTVIISVAVLICATWLGMFSYKHVDYADKLWWDFEVKGDASRFLRATVGVTIVVMLVLLRILLRPARVGFAKPSDAELNQASVISAGSDSTEGFLSLLGDKELLFNEDKSAYIMYRFTKRCGVALGDPIGKQSEFQELIWKFRDLCDEQDCVCAFYQVSENLLPLYIDAGLSLVKIGEEALVNLQTFTVEGSSGKAYRHVLNKLNKLGFSFNIVPISKFDSILPQLKEISDDWLGDKNGAEKGFSLGYFSEEYLKHFSTAIVLKDSKIYCFANIFETANKTELSIDLMRHLKDAPNGIMDFMMINLMLWGKQQGYENFNLGMAPLSGLPDHKLSSFWSRVGSYISTHGERFYKFEGLRKYKEKFDPLWSPKYLSHSGGIMLPLVLGDIASLISGGITKIVTKES